MARIPNDKDLFMAIPLWDFYVVDNVEMNMFNKSLLALNALDGSRFNPAWGEKSER